MPVKSVQELYDDAKNEIQARRPDLTDFNEGSILDILVGLKAMSVNEISRLAIEEFRKTFFNTANGPEVTGGADDLENLAIDHFGDEFARPEATFSAGIVTFSRENADAGDCVIEAGTVVKTPANAAGSSQRFEVISEVTLTGTSINASVRALVAGPAGDVQANTITEIETSLTDSSVTVTNADAFSGGEDEEGDSEYRETIRNLLKSLRGATLEAIEAKARTVAGVETVKGKEFVQVVKEWNEAEGQVEGEAFKITRVKLYVADANGTANQSLVSSVQAAISGTRAAGVKVEVYGATALSQNFKISFILNPEGPNYETLSEDPQLVLDSMEKYVQDLGIGEDFIRAAAKNYILSLWGPGGTGDLTNLTVLVPTGDVSVDENEKLIPGTMEVD